MRILLLQLKRIGDLTLTTAPIRALRSHLPNASLHLAVEANSAPLLPCIDHDHAFIFSRNSLSPLPWLRFALTACRNPYDFCFDFTANDRSALATLLSHARTRVIDARWQRRTPLRSKLYNAFPHADILSLHTADYLTSLLAPAGIPAPTPSSPARPLLSIPQPTADSAIELLRAHSIRPPFAILHPCTVKEEKFWLPDRWAIILDQLLRFGFSLLLTGTASSRDQAHIAQILAHLPSPHPPPNRLLPLTGKTNLPTLAALIALADFVLGVDSAPIHIADALNRPSLALFGPINPIQWQPRHPLSIAVTPLGTGPFHPHQYPKPPMSDLSTSTALHALHLFLSPQPLLPPLPPHAIILLIMDYQLPRSPWETVGGMVYFGRMLDKIRLHHAGTLRPDLIPNLGIGFDAACCEFLGIPYDQIRQRTLQGDSDEEIFNWCRQQGAPLKPHFIRLWNYAMTRRGWRDDLSERLQQRLVEGGWQHRTDIQTFFDYIDLDEGRDPANSPPKRAPLPT